jgi:cardiolipin synthase
VSGITPRYNRRNKFSFFQAEEVKLVKSGTPFYIKALEIIKNSKRTLHFQTYIFTDDSTGRLVIDALKDAVTRGVNVILMVDAFGSLDLSAHAIKEIEESGIKFRKFSPLFYKHSIRFGRRLHHKIILGDASEALIGGINVEDKYHIDGPETPWLDYAVYVKGEAVCLYIQSMCEALWKGKRSRIKRKKLIQAAIHLANKEHLVPVRISQNDWLYRKDRISIGLRHSLKHSRESVIIMASYFLPGGLTRRVLRKAARRNVKIKVILPGVSDVALAKKATMYLYGWMLKLNMEIYEWNKTILHGKVNLVDDKWASIGSYNINHLSHYSSVETNVEVSDAAFCHIVKHELNQIISQCHKVTYSEYLEKMNLWEKFTCWNAYQITRFLFWVEFILLSKKES